MSMSVVLYFHDKALAIYIGTSLFGLFISSVFPSTLALAELYINVTGKFHIFPKPLSESG